MDYIIRLLAFAWIVYALNGVMDRLSQNQRQIADLGVPRISATNPFFGS